MVMATTLYYGGWDKSSDCKNNDYLYKSGYDQWTLTPSSSFFRDVFRVCASGDVRDDLAPYDNEVRSAAFLKSNISITSGAGSSASPYQLSLN